MVLGYNHNVGYKGEVFHVQTEDSGVNNPHIITLLYRGGVILASKKTSYADIIKIPDLESVVEDLMKEQHKEMMRRLKSGDFDEKAFGAGKAAEQKSQNLDPLSALAAKSDTGTKADISMLFQMPGQPAAAPEPAKVENVQSLDEAILSFFGASDRK